MAHYELSNEKFLSEEELKELKRILLCYRTKSPRDTLLIELALHTGARESELLALTRQSINKVDRSVRVIGLKGSNSREIPLPDPLFKRLEAYSQALCGEKLFPITSRRLRQIWDFWRPVKKKFHSLRHTFAIELFKKHRDLRLVQVALGHRSINNTIIYSEYVYRKEELRRLIC